MHEYLQVAIAERARIAAAEAQAEAAAEAARAEGKAKKEAEATAEAAAMKETVGEGACGDCFTCGAELIRHTTHPSALICDGGAPRMLHGRPPSK